MYRHGGNVNEFTPDDGITNVIDFSVSINPYGPPEWLRREISRSTEHLTCYPDPDCTELRAALSEIWSVPMTHLVAANGTSELIQLLPRAF
ncbi:threonine-phosphate decarboxylase, partial [bacterium AH-315-E10]|nr:threonine-phosphate decarboxylase [bacterium AH-315-E10]